MFVAWYSLQALSTVVALCLVIHGFTLPVWLSSQFIRLFPHLLLWLIVVPKVLTRTRGEDFDLWSAGILPRNFRALVAALVYVVAAIAACALVSRYDTMQRLVGVRGSVLVLAAWFTGPVIEELMFRGWLFETSRRAWGLSAALAVNATLFGLLHLGMGQHAMISIALVSIVMFAIPRVLTGNVCAPIALHYLANRRGFDVPVLWSAAAVSLVLFLFDRIIGARRQNYGA